MEGNDIHEVTMYLDDDELTVLDELVSSLTTDYDLVRKLASLCDNGVLGVLSTFGIIKEAIGKARG